ncbi:sensor histidine kinase [Flaviaesturariibacter aridisoli]|nr:ATP-binding protein [Flaviaesturariibacter aridisoli]
MKLRLLLLLFSATMLSASAQTDSGLRGRTLFLEIERAKRLPPGDQPAALVRIARAAAESSQELTRLLQAAGSRESAPGSVALLKAAEARVSSLGADRNATDALTVADRALARLPADTATQVRLLLADAAAFAGQPGRSAAYRLQAEATLRGSDNPLDRLANLDALTRISNGPAVSSGYRDLLRTPSLGENDRVHILSRLLINLCRLGGGVAATGPAQELQGALARPPRGFDAAEADLARALFAESRSRSLEASLLYHRISTYPASPSATEGLIAAGDFYSRALRPDSARYYFALARQGAGWNEVPGLAYLWRRAQAAHAARIRQAPLPAAFRTALLQQDSMYRAELQASSRELALQYEVLESSAKTRALRDQQQLEGLRYKQQRQRTWIALLALGCFSLLALGAALLLNQRRRHAARLHAAELERRDVEHRARMMTELAQAQEAERGAIAGQLHDEIGTMLSVARMNLSAGTDPEHLQTAGKLLGDVAQTVRVMSHQLMPVALQQYGFRQAVEQLVADINAAGKLPVELALVGFESPRFTDLFYSTCYRMVQELLQNVLKHAGAGHALLQLVEHPELVSLMVEDDGCGLGPEGHRDGRGLRLLASRVAFLQGSLHIESSPGAGTTVIVELPVQPAFLIPNEHATTRTDLHRG